MNVQVIAEHSVDLDKIGFMSKVLDIGCRGFAFSKAMCDLGCQIYSVDVDELPVSEFRNESGFPLGYLRCAISDHDGMVGIERCSDPQATKIRPGAEVESMTLETISSRFAVDVWDLIKMDIEGAEYPVIMSMTRAIAKQLSVEFHLHTGAYGEHEMSLMENKLKSLGYVAVKHEYKSDHGAGFNYWDSLFILQ